MEIILGSNSPRRKEILSYFSLPFKQMASNFDEESLPFQGDPEEYVKALSFSKAKAIEEDKAIIITADTIVYQNGRIFGKPKNEKQAFDAFLKLVGNWHSVYTGVTIRCGDKFRTEVEETSVLFNQLTEKQIYHYLSRVVWQDKAGGYAIQMAGSLLVKRIEGCYYNVMGLPINTLESLLKHFGIELWDYL